MFRLILTLLFINAVFGAVPFLPRQIPNGRIVGGSNAVPAQFPYQVSLRDATNFHFCGGSILKADTILTAAHCVYGSSVSNVFVVAGSHLLSSGGIKYDTWRITVHPDYNRATLVNDLALLTLVKSLVFSDLIQPISLIKRDVQSGSLVVSGWGALSASGGAPDNLQYLYTNAITQEECASKIGTINPDTVCAFVSSTEGICFGDSGGPLVAQGEGQVGINSFVVGTCANGYPDGFCSVYYHRTWIMDQMTKKLR